MNPAHPTESGEPDAVLNEVSAAVVYLSVFYMYASSAESTKLDRIEQQAALESFHEVR